MHLLRMVYLRRWAIKETATCAGIWARINRRHRSLARVARYKAASCIASPNVTQACHYVTRDALENEHTSRNRYHGWRVHVAVGDD